jgi:hypothetical protein
LFLCVVGMGLGSAIPLVSAANLENRRLNLLKAKFTFCVGRLQGERLRNSDPSGGRRVRAV